MIRFIWCLLLMFILSISGQAQIDNIKSYYEKMDRIHSDDTITFVQPSMKLVEDYNNLNQIALIRHGEPALDKKGWFTRVEAQQFIHDYDIVGVEALHFIPFALQPHDPIVIHTSTLNRAKHTARLIFGQAVIYSEDPLFREFERKIILFPNVKMPLKFWLLSARLSWLLGGNNFGIESFKSAKKRSDVAADKLINMAKKNNKAILVAHGFLNRQLVKSLKKKGWTVVRDGGRQYLATTLLVKVNERP